ncbi:hypothetical protein [Thermostaphylospora chromogena]|uniref:hypothetical protein n=1 Tax=Thermostaphylospora chromogena TaxID=35622 RepID=UPI001A96FC5B|nr:hypothetical protein [Thermostaphylospora chromogena]
MASGRTGNGRGRAVAPSAMTGSTGRRPEERSAAGPAVERLPLPAGAALSLAAGLYGGVARLADGVSAPSASAAQHGPLMVLGFLGTLISLERAVALRSRWAYLAPALAACGGLLAFTGVGEPSGRLALTAAAAWLVAIHLVPARRRPGWDTALQVGGSLAWYAGGMLWLTGRPPADLVPWFAAFLVLTIAGERLEPARIAFTGRLATGGLAVCGAVVLAGAAVSAWTGGAGWRITGIGMLATAGWLARYDIVRRTVRSTGLPRYTAVCLLAGYAWLAAAGALWAVHGRPEWSFAYDAALHALFIGFVISMVFGHAPVILPAVLRIRLPYHPVLYPPLVLLHAGLAVRVAGDAVGDTAARTAGGVLGGAAIVLFAGCTVAAARLTRPAAARRTGGDEEGTP